MLVAAFVTEITVLLLQNSFPVWEDFNAKAGRMHAALRLDFMCSLYILLTLSPPIPLRLYSLPYWSNSPFLIFDIRALWRSVQSQKLKMVG